jgi:hypothetical protein
MMLGLCLEHIEQKKMLEPQPFSQSGNFYGSIQNMMCNVLVESNLGHCIFELFSQHTFC